MEGAPHFLRCGLSGIRGFAANGETQERIPWVWYAPTIDGNPPASANWLFQKLIENGVAIAGIDVGETLCNLSARAQFWQFYQEIVPRFSEVDEIEPLTGFA